MPQRFAGASHHSEIRNRPMHISNHRKRPSSVGIAADLLPFTQWQARQLASRDAMFGVFLVLVYIVYLQKTIPDLCASTPAVHAGTVGIQLQNKQQQWPVLWSLVCDDAATAAGILAPSMNSSWVLQSAVRALQGLATFFCAGLLSNDPIHIFVGSLRLSLLVLITANIPYINLFSLQQIKAHISSSSSSSNSSTTASSSSSSRGSGSSTKLINWYHPDLYWQNPSFRICIISAQRLVPPAVELLCWNMSGCHMGWYASVQKSPMTHELGKYMFQGWVAGTLMLRLRAHLIVNIIEWFLIYMSSSYTMGTSNPSSSSSSSVFWDFKCLCTSFVCVTILPTLCVWCLERSQKRRYQQLKHTQAATDGKVSVLDKAHAGSSSSSCSSSKSAANTVDAVHNSREPESEDSCCNSSSSLACIQGAALEDTAMEVTVPCLLPAKAAAPPHTSSDTYLQSTTAAAAAGLDPILSDLVPIISRLLGGDAADTIFAAAAVSVSSSGYGSSAKSYISTAAALSVSIKVNDPGHSVSRLATLLSSVLHYQLMSGHNTHSESLAIHTAAFEGCVQLVANVIGLRRDIKAAAAAAGGSMGGSSKPRSAAALLLLRVQQSIQAWATAAAAAGGPGNSLAAAVSQPAVDVTFGGDAASSASNHTSSSSSGGGSSARRPSVVLHFVDPICVIADQAEDQEIRLSLTLSGQQQQQQQPGCCCHGAAAAPSGPDPESTESASPGCQVQVASGLPGSARLLVLRDGRVLWDQDVSLIDGRISTSVSLAPQSPGALHLALLPVNTPAAAAEATAAGNPEASAAAALPVLQPLLVLPAAAAADLQQYHENLKTLDQNLDQTWDLSDGCASEIDSDLDAAAAAASWQNVSAITVDVTYILTTCATAAAAAECKGGSAVKQQIPSSVRRVLKSLLVHLACCGMFEMMAWLVDVVAAVYVNHHGSSSSSGSNDSVVVPGTDLPAAPACSTSSRLDASICSSSSSTNGSTGVTNRKASGGEGRHSRSVKHSSSDSSGRSATAAAAATVGVCLAPITSSSVAASELLWGFRDPTIEARYQAAAFTSSGLWDFISFAFTACVSLPFFFTKHNSSSSSIGVASAAEQHAAAAAASWSSSWARMTPEALSDWLLTFAYLSGPLLVLLLRIRTAWQLQQQQQQRDPAAATAILFREAAIKQRLLLFWMAIIPLMLAVFAVSDVLVTPGWVVRVWSTDNTTADIGCVAVVAIKGWTGQIPFAAFWPILAAQGLSSILGSVRYGARPYYWLALRYIAMVLLPTAVNARQHIQGRRAFCARQGITVR